MLGLLLSVPAAAQPPQTERPGAVHIIVRDVTLLPVAGAEIALTAADGFSARTRTSDRGEAGFEGLRPGTYSSRVESVGFEPFIESFSVASGARLTREVTLRVAGFAERLEVTPSSDGRELMNAFTGQFTDDQLAALPEDPEELALEPR